MQARTARVVWRQLEPIHAVTYFAPRCRAAFSDVGLRGFWMGYFARRAAPLGAVGPAVVTATFINFPSRDRGDVDELVRAARHRAAPIAASGDIPFPNPMGLPPPDGDGPSEAGSSLRGGSHRSGRPPER